MYLREVTIYFTVTSPYVVLQILKILSAMLRLNILVKIDVHLKPISMAEYEHCTSAILTVVVSIVIHNANFNPSQMTLKATLFCVCPIRVLIPFRTSSVF